MAEDRDDVMEIVARDWCMARAVIVAALAEWFPGEPLSVHERRADAIMARLASHQPPLLIYSEPPKG